MQNGHIFGLCIWGLIVGYLIGYYFRQPGNWTVGKLIASS